LGQGEDDGKETNFADTHVRSSPPVKHSADENAQIAASMRNVNEPPTTPKISKNKFWGFGSNDRIPDLLSTTPDKTVNGGGEIVEMSSITVRL
jgi:hypothetical protein